MQAELEIQRATTTITSPDDARFQGWINAVPVDRDCKYSLTIRIVDEQEAQRFNREYRNRDYATNVLSFPAELPEGLPAEFSQSQLGDILICAPVVVREASEQQRPEANHWAHLTIHGILHLLGYDHEQPDEAVVMESLETEILKNIGISDPYLDLR
ncbi:MAG: rRNA maturation RNase YbeY [Xanthomonadales bacterium]|nr:rRNA maturation RNase YbeY [Xanthomonadales bacterium]